MLAQVMVSECGAQSHAILEPRSYPDCIDSRDSGESFGSRADLRSERLPSPSGLASNAVHKANTIGQ